MFNKIYLIIFRIVMFAGFVLMMTLLCKTGYKTSICNVKVQGSAILARDRLDASMIQFDKEIVYSYEYKGKIYMGEDVTTSEKIDALHNDGNITIRINKNDPSISLFDTKLKQLTFYVFNALLCLICFVASFKKKKK